MGVTWFQPGCPCCCPRIGQAGGEMTTPSFCCENTLEITGLRFDVSQIWDQDLVFCGNAGCAYENFSSSDWTEVADWVIAGGRLIAVGNPMGGGPHAFECMLPAHRTDINNFLNALGTSLSVGDAIGYCTFPFGGSCNDIGQGEPNHSLGINEGITTVYFNYTNFVGGGTSIATTRGGTSYLSITCPPIINFVAGEVVGDGFVMVTGSSSVMSGCGGNNCQLFKNMWEKDASDLL